MLALCFLYVRYAPDSWLLPTRRTDRRINRQRWERDDRAVPEDYPCRLPSSRRAGIRRRRTIRGSNGSGSTRTARHRHRPGDGRRHHARRLGADPVARRAPRLGHLSAAGAARGLASRPDAGAGRGGRGRAVVRIFFLFSVSTASISRGRTRSSICVLFMVVAVVTSHLANSMKQQTEIARKREKEMSDLYAFSRRLAAASSAGRHLSRDRGASREPGPAQGGAVRRRRRRRSRRKPDAGGGVAARAFARSPTFSAGRTLATTVDDRHRRYLAGASRVAEKRRLRRHRHRSRQRAGQGRRARFASGSTTCCRTPPPRSSGSTSRARSTTPRCAPRPSCCARR